MMVSMPSGLRRRLCHLTGALSLRRPPTPTSPLFRTPPTGTSSQSPHPELHPVSTGRRPDSASQIKAADKAGRAGPDRNPQGGRIGPRSVHDKTDRCGPVEPNPAGPPTTRALSSGQLPARLRPTPPPATTRARQAEVTDGNVCEGRPRPLSVYERGTNEGQTPDPLKDQIGAPETGPARRIRTTASWLARHCAEGSAPDRARPDAAAGSRTLRGATAQVRGRTGEALPPATARPPLSQQALLQGVPAQQALSQRVLDQQALLQGVLAQQALARPGRLRLAVTRFVLARQDQGGPVFRRRTLKQAELSEPAERSAAPTRRPRPRA